MTRKEERRAKGRRGAGDMARYKPPKFFSYCPNCLPADPKFPATAPHITNPTKKEAVCSRCKTRWTVLY